MASSSNPPGNGPTRRRFLIGKGETITAEGKPKTWRRPPPPAPPRTLEQALAHLKTRAQAVANDIESLPRGACPDDHAVVMVTMHPEGQSKGHFPGSLLRCFDLAAIGSHKRHVRVEAWSGKPSAKRLKAHEDNDGLDTIELFVAGPRESLRRWSDGLDLQRVSTATAVNQILYIEDIRPISALEKRVEIKGTGAELSLEVALHQMAGVNVVRGFERFVSTLGGRILKDGIVDLAGLTFVPTIIPAHEIAGLSQYTFLRSARKPGHLRSLLCIGAPDLLRANPIETEVILPTDPPSMSSGTARSVILDAGLPPDHGLPHVLAYYSGELDPPDAECGAHGLAVTAAATFGEIISPTKPAIATEHYQVIGTTDGGDDFQLLRVLSRIREAIGTTDPHRPTFINISLGPDCHVEDDYVHPWTSTLDEIAAAGNRLVCVAVGNNGANDPATARIQIPADGVNVLGVGAHDKRGANWAKATYSAVGPGRRPGYVKPDLLAHGGCPEEPFLGLALTPTGHVARPTAGTSFATPLVHHSATQVHAVYDGALSPLAIRALLIHTADPAELHREHVGHGRIGTMEELLSVSADAARVIYQGSITARKMLRARIPVPANLQGMIEICATLCTATPTSAADPFNYTNAGIDAWFVRNGKLPEDPDQQLTDDHARFFSPPDPHYATEAELRSIHHKWETTLHHRQEFRASSLESPCLDLHHVPRAGAMDSLSSDPVAYALVVTIRCQREPNIHDKILSEFRSLSQLQPISTRLPVRLG